MLFNILRLEADLLNCGLMNRTVVRWVGATRILGVLKSWPAVLRCTPKNFAEGGRVRRELCFYDTTTLRYRVRDCLGQDASRKTLLARRVQTSSGRLDCDDRMDPMAASSWPASLAFITEKFYLRKDFKMSFYKNKILSFLFK